MERKHYYFDGTEVNLKVARYENGNLYVGLVTSEGEPFGDLTVNLPLQNLYAYEAYLNVHASAGIENFVKKNGLAENLKETAKCGYNEYPLYIFDADILREAAPIGYAEYKEEK